MMINMYNFQRLFGVRSIIGNDDEVTAALYLQVSIISQALIFVTRSQSWSFVERPSYLLMFAFVAAQIVSTKYPFNQKNLLIINGLLKFECFIQLATLLAVYADWDFAEMQGVGWRWAGVIWFFSIVSYFPLDILKFMIHAAIDRSSR